MYNIITDEKNKQVLLSKRVNQIFTPDIRTIAARDDSPAVL